MRTTRQLSRPAFSNFQRQIQLECCEMVAPLPATAAATTCANLEHKKRIMARSERRIGGSIALVITLLASVSSLARGQQHHNNHHHHQLHTMDAADGGDQESAAAAPQKAYNQMLGPYAAAQLAPPSAGQHRLPQPLALIGTQAAPLRQVNPGDRVNIPCSLANMGGSIQFAKDDQPIVLDSGCAHCQLDISNDGQASLTINRVSQRDQGHWQCWRLDAQGKVKQKIPILQLEVTNSPELPILVVNEKELLAGNNLDATITVRENELVSFKCVIKGAQTPVEYVHWMLDSTQNVTSSSHYAMDYSQQDQTYLTTSQLKLNATKSMNLKSVSCLSFHKLWTTPMIVTAFLNVLYEPSFTISREPGFGVPVSEGMSVILKCEIDSNPASSPVWIKDADNKTSTSQSSQAGNKEATGEPLVLDTQEDGSVSFSPAQRSDSGWYRCKTENKYGNFSSFGYYLNVRANTQPQPQAPPAASSSAPQAASPAPAPLQPPPPHHIGRHHSQQQHHFNARISPPNQAAPLINQAGRQLSNIINNDQPSSPLAAIPPPPTPAGYSAPPSAACKPGKLDGAPEIEMPVSTVQAQLDRQLILHLKFCCNPGPAHVFWIHRHLAMVPGRMFGPYITRDIYTSYNSFYCYESTFEIESVKPEDIGTIYMFVSNEKGHAGAQIRIQLAQQQKEALGSSRFHLTPAGSSSSLSIHNKLNLNLLTMALSLVLALGLILNYRHR